MKKIFKKWFTFIELLIVITIIWIISFFSFGSFFDFLKNKEFAIKINNLENIIKEEDLKINKKEIFDYEIIFDKNNDYFKIFENNYSIWEKIIIESIWNDIIKFKIKENNLNNISIKKYDLEEEIVLKEISDSKEKINKYNSVKIENIFWRKKIYKDWNLVKKVYLFFEDKNWKEFYFLIKN